MLPALFTLDVATLRYGNMSWADADGRDKLSSLCYLSRLISVAGFRTADLLSAVVKPDGPPSGRGSRLSPDFDLKEEIRIGRVNVLTNTDFPERRNRAAPNHTSYFYNSLYPQLVGNYENWVFARPVKDWSLTSSKCTLDNLDMLMGIGLANVSWSGPPRYGDQSTDGST